MSDGVSDENENAVCMLHVWDAPFRIFDGAYSLSVLHGWHIAALSLI